ncbi:hypothetical protein D3C75_175030 [compost metagenome]
MKGRPGVRKAAAKVDSDNRRRSGRYAESSRVEPRENEQLSSLCLNFRHGGGSFLICQKHRLHRRLKLRSEGVGVT